MQASVPAVDLAAVKTKQQVAWAAGDYAVIGTTLQIVGESLCEALDLRAGSRVLDVAAGNGNATLAAARRFCDVTATDYVPALLEQGQRRAAAEGLEVTWLEADAEKLPFAAESFDVVLSTFGVMFTPDQPRAAAELARVVTSLKVAQLEFERGERLESSRAMSRKSWPMKPSGVQLARPILPPGRVTRASSAAARS